MKLTVTLLNQTLKTIIDADVNASTINSNLQKGYVKMTITNNSANIVYIDTWITASDLTSNAIAVGWGTRTFLVINQSDINLITVIADWVIDIDFDYPESRI